MNCLFVLKRKDVCIMIKDELEKIYGSYPVFDKSSSNQANIDQLDFALNYKWKILDEKMSGTRTISESRFLKRFYNIMDLKIHYQYILEEVLQKRYGFKLYGISTTGNRERLFINHKYLPH